ncbi:Methyltransferase domain-containing protein [Pseudomonas kuykendallii]|uniref:Methyltransferase domain-containing protein n=1 Tax=Pseudomonas kuykendallii TaxID=1007099 RepID=A0A1H3FT10_9PSED|nr:sulfatase-like hydrolase/transferase [Pseudomonas kuykendallii]SDX94070.1 Methyltransferase domain-containing protein [Pseudomonas kuykendallii]
MQSPDNTVAIALVARSVFPCLMLALALWPRRLPRKRALLEFVALEALGLVTPSLLWLPLALAYGVAVTLDRAFYARLGWPVDADALRFARREPANAKLLLRQELGARDGLLLLAVLGACLLAATGPAFAAPAGLLVVLWAGYLGVNGLSLRRGSPRLPVPNLVLAWWKSRREPERVAGLAAAQREELPRLPAAGPFSSTRQNVLLIVCESLSRRVLESPAGRAATPRYQAFVRQEIASGRLVDFPQALANSSSSDIAYASLFTGLSPEQSWERFHRTPLLWDAAKARGYHTSFYSSQSLDWCGLEAFLIGPSLDRAVYREVLGEPAVNDMAMDDRVLNRYLTAELPRCAAPFFSVVNYNMLHAPFSPQGGDKPTSTPSALADYLDALRLFDTCLGELLDCLSASGQLDNTLIAFTADHGETPERYDRQQARRMPLRLDQLDLDNLSVPFWLRWPANALDDAQCRQLRANVEVTVSHIDLYPTLLQLFGVDLETRQRLGSGQSLLAPIAAGRTLLMHNTSAFRQWACEPFALSRQRWLLIYHDLTRHFELLDLRNPAHGDHWERLEPEERLAWLAELAGHPLAAEILARRQLLAPPPPVSAVAAQYDELARDSERSDLHELNNWGLFSRSDWQAFCQSCARFIGVQDGDRVFEAGCGSGAFLHALQAHWQIEIDGMDLSAELIRVAQSRLQGEFWVGDVQDLSHATPNHYDKVVSNAVFLYLPSRAACERAALEMVRLARPGGLIYIGLLNDPERLGSYHSEHRPSGNAFLRRSFWHDLGERHGLAVETVDQDALYSKADGYDAHARLRYSVRMRKPVAGIDG